MHVNDGMPELEQYSQDLLLLTADWCFDFYLFSKMFIPYSALYSENTFQNDSHDRAETKI